KGFATDMEALTVSTPTRSYQTFDTVSAFDRGLREERRIANNIAGFKYIGEHYSELHTESGYFNPFTYNVDSNKAYSSLTSKNVYDRLEMELGSKGMLGKGVNMQSMVDDMISKNLNSLPDELIPEFDKLLKNVKLNYIDREFLIDTFVKT